MDQQRRPVFTFLAIKSDRDVVEMRVQGDQLDAASDFSRYTHPDLLPRSPAAGEHSRRSPLNCQVYLYRSLSDQSTTLSERARSPMDFPLARLSLGCSFVAI